jgi:hypothetical protein
VAQEVCGPVVAGMRQVQVMRDSIKDGMGNNDRGGSFVPAGGTGKLPWGVVVQEGER